VAEVTLTRPKALNAINRQMLTELRQMLADLRQVDNLTCVILTGAGEKAFVAGADISEMAGMSARDANEFARQGHHVLNSIESFPAPVIAAVNGFALGGGCELAMACDVIYAAETAKFGQPEVKLGLIPGFGGCVRLPRRAGRGVAAEWIYTGEIYGAARAKEVGLVTQIFPAAELLPKVREIARTIAKRAPLAVRAAKRVLIDGMTVHPHAAGAMEQLSFSGLFNSKDTREGCQAFVEKREPNFKGE
jgi:enoyl-CoA hydratase